ncbi:MAG TPA: hypothetical protein VFI86_06055, partial [Burkholderiales bacterium]|nr:hypothetical protein [Burkholderiales bacterium]
AYDLRHPARFLNADRAGERFADIQGFGEALRSGGALAWLAGHGIAGDWLPQGVLYLAGGQYLVIAAQVALALASVAWLREIALGAGLDERRASAAATLYALLPHTLVFPHQLASEALFVPLVVLAFRQGSRGGLALGVATLVRPLTVLWPLVAARGWRFVAAALLPLLAWMTFVLAATGEFSMGRSGHDLGHNLRERMERIAATLAGRSLPGSERPAAGKTATLGEYLGFVARHPLAALRHSARDMVALCCKSGIERVTLDYLDLFPEARGRLQASDGGWRSALEQRGFGGALAGLLSAQPALVLSSALAAVLFTGLMALALGGALALRRNREAMRLALFVLYVFATAQAVDAAQSRHRAPAEFALCVLALAGWAALERRRRPGR